MHRRSVQAAAIALALVLVAACGSDPAQQAESDLYTPPIRLMAPLNLDGRILDAKARFPLDQLPEDQRLPPEALRDGIALAPNDPGVRQLAEILMFLPGNTAGRDSRASLLTPAGGVYRYRVQLFSNALLRTAAGYPSVPEGSDGAAENLGRTLRFQVELTPVPPRIPSDEESPRLLIDEVVEIRKDGAWLPLTADLSPWAGREVDLQFTVRDDAAESTEGLVPMWAGWANPEIVDAGDRQQEGFDLLWLSLDTLRADRLGTYGYTRRPTSPHLDRFAAEGVVFETAVSQAPWTRPSHRSMFNGNYPSSNHGHANFPLAVALWRQGWRNGALTGGGQVDSRLGFHRGFDTYRVQYWHEDIDSVARWYEANRGRRTFLFLHTFAAHDPYTDHRFAKAESLPSGRIGDQFSQSQWLSWHSRISQEEQAYVDALYDGGIAALDESLGKLFAWLKASGRLDRTLVVITSDHGEQLFEHGSWRHGSEVYDHQILVPTILHLPPKMRADLSADAGAPPTRVADQIQLIDLYPTVLELLGARFSHPIQGRSLVPLLRGESLEPRMAFVESTNVKAFERKAFRTPRWKLIWQHPKGRQRTGELVRLYDLRRDPEELHDISQENREAVVHHLALMQSLVEGGTTPETEVPDDLPPDLRERLRALGYID